MATPPTFIAEDEVASWQTTTSPRSLPAFSPAAGDLLLAFIAIENTAGAANRGSISGGPTWSNTREQPGGSGIDCYTRVMQATAAGGSITPSITDSGGGGTEAFGANVLEFANTTGVGATAGTTNGVTGLHPTLAITTQADNSAIAVIFADFSAAPMPTSYDTVNGATPTVQTSQQFPSRYTTAVVWYADAGVAGSKTVGATFPSGSPDVMIIAVEIKGTTTAVAGDAGQMAVPGFLTLPGGGAPPFGQQLSMGPAWMNWMAGFGGPSGPPPAVGGAYTLLQSPAVANAGSGATVNKAFASNVAAHSLLVAEATIGQSGTMTATFSSPGATWATIGPFLDSNTTQQIAIGYCLDAPAGATTVTVTWNTGGGFLGLIIAEYQAPGAVASLLDANTTGQSFASTTTPTDSAMTASGAQDLAISYVIYAGAATTIGAGTGFAITQQDATDQAAAEHDLQVGPGSVTPGFTLLAARAGGIISALFKPSVSGNNYTQSMSGSSTPTGVLAKLDTKPLPASSTPTGAFAQQARKALVGSATPGGVLNRLIGKAFTGGSTATGALALARTVRLALVGSSTPSGGLAKQARKPLTGTSTPTGALTTARVVLLALAGASTPTGAVTKLVGKALTGSSTPAGLAAKQARKPPAGAATPTGALTRATGKALAGASTAAGAVALARTVRLALVGSSTAGGSVSKQARKSLLASATPSGTLAKQTAKQAVGSSTPSGVLTTAKVILRAFAGSATPTGALAKLTSKPLAGASTPVGAQLRLTLKALAGASTPTGAGTFTRGAQTFFATLTGSSTPTGALAKQARKALGGAGSSTGTLTNRASKALAGSASPSGLLTRLAGKTLAGSSTPTGTLTLIRAVIKLFTGSSTPVGVLGKQVGKPLAGSSGPVGALAKLIGKKPTGQATPTGALAAIRTVLLAVAGSSTPTGSVVRTTRVTRIGASTPTGLLTKLISRKLAGASTPSGALVAGHLLFRTFTGAVQPLGTLTKLIRKPLAGTSAPIGGLAKTIKLVLLAFAPTSGDLARLLNPDTAATALRVRLRGREGSGLLAGGEGGGLLHGREGGGLLSGKEPTAGQHGQEPGTFSGREEGTP